MAAVSFYVPAGGTLKDVTAGTQAPSSGAVEIRIDQTTTTVTDNGSTRALKRGEALVLIGIITQAILASVSLNE